MSSMFCRGGSAPQKRDVERPEVPSPGYQNSGAGQRGAMPCARCDDTVQFAGISRSQSAGLLPAFAIC
jgi:hypothetical protein